MRNTKVQMGNVQNVSRHRATQAHPPSQQGGDTITYRATGPYRALSCCVIGQWATGAGVQLRLESGECRLHQIKACRL